MSGLVTHKWRACLCLGRVRGKSQTLYLIELKASLVVGHNPDWGCVTECKSYKNLASVKGFWRHRAPKLIQNKTHKSWVVFGSYCSHCIMGNQCSLRSENACAASDLNTYVHFALCAHHTPRHHHKLPEMQLRMEIVACQEAQCCHFTSKGFYTAIKWCHYG